MERSLGYTAGKYPEFAEDARGVARIQAQRAFADAAQGKRCDAWQMIRGCVRMNWREPRTPVAAAVALRAVRDPDHGPSTVRTGPDAAELDLRASLGA